MVRDLLEWSEEVPLEPPSQWRAWLGLILSGDLVPVLPYPVFQEHLEDTLGHRGVSEVASQADESNYGAFLEGSVGRV